MYTKRKRAIYSFYAILMTMFCGACMPKTNEVESLVKEYYEVFNERKNIEEFLSFYADSIVLEDLVNGDRVVGKAALRNFYDWENSNYKSLDENSLEVFEQIVQEKQAVVKGYFTPFEWEGMVFEAMHFTTILTFDAAGKIIRQVDWINYPSSLVDYNQRKNSNDWLPSNHE